MVVSNHDEVVSQARHFYISRILVVPSYSCQYMVAILDSKHSVCAPRRARGVHRHLRAICRIARELASAIASKGQFPAGFSIKPRG